VKKYPHSNIDDILYERKVAVKRACSFGCKKSFDYLLRLVKDLNLRINLLDPPTSPEDFVRILMAKELGSVHENIYLGCNTNEFAYLVKKHVKHIFKSFTPATIGRSGLFIGNTGKTITANCLYNCKSERLQTKIAIDNIFNIKR